MSFSNFCSHEWKGMRRLNHFIPRQVWFRLIMLYYHSLPKHKKSFLNKGRSWAKKIGRKVFNFNGYMGTGFDGNWVGPDLRLKFFYPKRMESIEFGGEAFFPLILRVFINNKWIRSQDISKGEFIVRIPLGSRLVHNIRIMANHCIIPFPPIVNTKISYRLNWCNFFDDLSFPIHLDG